MRPTPSLPSDYESTSPETSLSPLTPSDGSPIDQPHPLLGSCSSPPPSERRRPTSHGVAPPRLHCSRLENSSSVYEDYSDRRYGPEGTRVLHQAAWNSYHRDNHTYHESNARNSSNGSFVSTTPRVQIYNQDNQEGRTRDFSPLPYYSRETGYRGSYYQESYYGRAASRSDGSYNHHRYEPCRYTDSGPSSSNMDVDVYPGTSSNNHHAPSRPVDTRPTVTLPSIRSLEDISEHLLRPIDMFRFQNGRDNTTNLPSSHLLHRTMPFLQDTFMRPRLDARVKCVPVMPQQRVWETQAIPAPEPVTPSLSPLPESPSKYSPGKVKLGCQSIDKGKKRAAPDDNDSPQRQKMLNFVPLPSTM
ncbi:hypothetical protein K435DRAFT_878406 [Dendrothele bispora CBS 962.96]|uniref:Uncharacterized protein n=1 Tax=Dendrothele bispora (strain CBS 962.96) TaxID=1314807 RepID=A0A4S8KP04_DENBC|nr:hypothetical protein K435DRAFT_878406 [Dendrothele bispora CBS 962.96]